MFTLQGSRIRKITQDPASWESILLGYITLMSVW